MRTLAAIARSSNAEFMIEEVDLADPGPGEVRVKVRACGICRSDLSALEGRETIEFPAVLGHEAAGVVEAKGDRVTSVREGDEVVLSWTPACGTCPACMRKQVHLCHGINMTTHRKGPLSQHGEGLDRFMGLGAFCEHVVVPEAMAVPVVTGLSPTHTCLIGCAVTTGFGAAVNTAAIRWGQSVAVFGCGGIGLAAIQGARTAGAAKVFAVDPVAERRQAALRVGATQALEPSAAKETILADTAGGVDVAIECVGQVTTMQDCFEIIREGGRAVVVGLPGFTEELSIPAIMLLREKVLTGSIYGSSTPSVDFQKIARLAEHNQLQLLPLVDRTRHFSEINEGFREMRDGKLTRVVLTF